MSNDFKHFCGKFTCEMKLLQMKLFICPVEFDAETVGSVHVPDFLSYFPVPLCVLIEVNEAPNTTDATTIKPNMALMMPVRHSEILLWPTLNSTTCFSICHVVFIWNCQDKNQTCINAT